MGRNQDVNCGAIKKIDVRQNTMEVTQHINELSSQLSQQQKTEKDQLVATIKQRVYSEIEEKPLNELYKLKKTTSLESLTDEAMTTMPDIPRDLFMYKFHYVMNGFQQRVENRIGLLKWRAAQEAKKVTKDAQAATEVDPGNKTSGDETVIESTQHHTEAGHSPDVAPASTSPLSISTETTLTSNTSADVSEATTPRPTISTTTQTEYNSSSSCITECKFTDQDTVKGNWLRCIICMRWCHCVCCSEEEKYDGAFTCPRCRAIPDDLTSIKQMVMMLTEKVNQLTAAIVNKPATSSSSHHQQPDVNKPATSSSSHHQQPEVNKPATSSSSHHQQPEDKPATSSSSHQQQPEDKPATSSSSPQHHQQIDVQPEAQAPIAPESEMDSISVHEDITSTPLPVHNQFDVLSQTFDMIDVDNDSDFDTNPGAASVITTPPSNQEAWLQQVNSKKKTAANVNKTSLFTVTVLSDSMFKKVDVGHTEALCSEANCQLNFVHNAATIGDAVSCIQRSSEEELPAHLQVHNIDINHEEPLVIHTGTNHVEKEGVTTITRRLERLEHNLRIEGYTRVALSSIVYRRSNSPFEREKIAALNNVILCICSRNGWTYVDNDNVNESCLIHGDKVHPNKYGCERLSHNIATAVKQLILDPHQRRH